MKSKYLIAPALVIGGLLGGPESLPATYNAAHRAPSACEDYVYDSFGDPQLLRDAVDLNIQLSIAENKPTSKDNANRVTDEYVSTLEKRDDFIDDNFRKIGSYTLEKSGIRIDLSSDSPWELSDPQKFEATLEQAYRTEDKEDPLQSAVNSCIADLVFDQRALDGVWLFEGLTDLLDLTIVGGGEYCFARDRVMSIYDGVDCPTAGITSYSPWGQKMYLAPVGPKSRTVEESATLYFAHETDHWIRNNLNVRAHTKKKFEYAAFELIEAYNKVIANQDDYAVFSLSD